LSATDFASLDIHPVDADLLLGLTKPDAEEDAKAGPSHSPILIRRKEFEGQELTVSQALDNMELLGHDFYLFVDLETRKPSVVYKRKGWNYGVIALG
jgi:hypothetical protein